MTMVSAFNWPVLDPEAICLTQTNDIAGGSLIINGNLSAYVGNTPETYVPFQKIYRCVRITSTAADNSGVQFTITGILNGEEVSETITGPGIGLFVETDQYYESITSVITDVQAVDVQIGSGSYGQTAWYLYDYNRSISSTLFQVNVEGVINYSVLETLDDVSDDTLYTYDITGSLTSKTVDAFGSISTIPFRYASCFINSSDETGELNFKVMQGGRA